MIRLLLFFVRNQLIFGIWVENVRIESVFFLPRLKLYIRFLKPIKSLEFYVEN